MTWYATSAGPGSKGQAADATENDDWDLDLPYPSFFQSDIVGTDTLAW